MYIEMKLRYWYNGDVYPTLEKAVETLMEARPDLLDDDLPDAINYEIEEEEFYEYS